jgi:AbrB family looped-hinge helix DNA binding protein
MTYNYAITSKGQITLPKDLRDAIGLKLGGRASISLLDDRSIVLRAPMPIESIRASVGKPSKKQPLSAKEQERLSARGLI